MSKKNWFITGCSTGLGRELAKYAALQGDNVIGTLRKEGQINEFNTLSEGLTFGVKMDVTNPTLVENAVKFAFEKWGRIDVLVNNAGYGSLGSVEEVTEEEMKHQFDVNVFGAVRVTQAILPIMRKQRSGHILNITSIAGLQGYPGVGIYNGSKFALEGIGEALEKEVSPLGIKVTNVEPGPFRTDWAGRSATYTPTKIDDYTRSAAQNMEAIQGVSGKQIGDPIRAAKAMYDLTLLDNPPVHLPLGGPAYKRLRAKLVSFTQEVNEFEYLGLPTDYTEEELNKLES